MLRGHIDRSAFNALAEEVAQGLQILSHTEVADEHFAVTAHQQVLRLDIAVNDAPVMRILQASRDLFDIANYYVGRELRTLGMAVAQGAVGGVLEHNIGYRAL